MSTSLEPVREVWSQRSEARTRTDVLYLVYVVVLSVGIVGAPALHGAGELLARPDVMPFLLREGAPSISTVIVLLGGAGLLLLGAVRGPALLPPFFTATLGASGIRRRAVLWRPFLRALLIPVLSLTVPAVLVGSTLRAGAGASLAEVALFALACLGAGMLLGVAWLGGQLLLAGARRLVALVLVVGAVGAVAAPLHLGVAAVYPGRSQHGGAWTLGLLGAGILAVGLSIPLLDRLRGAVLAQQAARWDAAAQAATTMDLTTAAGTFRELPLAGRRLPAIGGGGLVVLYARRDAVAWLRTPERSAVAVLGALLGGAAVGGATLLSGPTAWTMLLVGALVLRAAGGAFVDGIRHGVHTLGAPRLFGQSAGAQVLVHLTAPLLLLGVLAGLGSGSLGLLGAAADGLGVAAVLLPVLLAAVLVVARAWEAAKGTIPLALSTPMPTPQGDLSVVLQLGWHADAVVLALAVAAALLLLVPSGPWMMVCGAAMLIALLALLARKRLRALTD